MTDLNDSLDMDHSSFKMPSMHNHMSHGKITGVSFHDGNGNTQYFDDEMNHKSSLMKVGNITYHHDDLGNLLNMKFDDSIMQPKDWIGSDGNYHHTPDFLNSNSIGAMRNNILGRIK